MILVNNGVTTGEQVLVPECVHTITMEWYSLHRHDHVSSRFMYSAEWHG